MSKEKYDFKKNKQNFDKKKSKSYEAKSYKNPYKIKSNIDPKLKKIFTEIGIPEKTPFKPDNFQIKAIETIEKTDCLVTAPTGAGKTWIATQAIKTRLLKNEKSWYASPLKALTNSKYIEFSEIFGAENVGILTGDRKDNPGAKIIVGTTEILRNQLYDSMNQGCDLSTDFVILDEAHYLGDEERGVVWEEIMIYLPIRIPILLLSATIGNANEIANWLTSLRNKKCIVVNETTRPVELFHLFYNPKGIIYPLITNANSKDKINKKSKIYIKVEEYLKKTDSNSRRFRSQLPPFGKILKILKKLDLLPAIFFLKSRADCNKAVDSCNDNYIHNKDKKINISNKLDEILNKYPYLKKHQQLWHVKNLAVGSHHSGQLYAWKILLENLMVAGLLDAIFATSTVAAGVNFPARTIVVLNSDRFNGSKFCPLTSTQFHQMTGRSGRRGMDNIGFSLIMPEKFMDVNYIVKLINSPVSNVKSQIKINFSMVLNLLYTYTIDQVEDMLKKSFATFQNIEKNQKLSDQFLNNKVYKILWNDFLRHANFLKETKYVTIDNKLTEDGIWASKLRIDQPLVVAQCIKLNILPIDNPLLLASVMTIFVNEQDYDTNFNYEKVPKDLLICFYNIHKKITPFIELLLSKGFMARDLFIQPAVAIYKWAQNMKWENVCDESNMAEGDLAMLILRTVDHLRHIRALSDVFPKAADSATTAIDLVLKEPVIF